VSPSPDPIDELGQILGSRFRAPRPDELHDDLDLGGSGFGLDSISLTELLIVCEDHFRGALHLAGAAVHGYGIAQHIQRLGVFHQRLFA
jgi:hypothetical protein